MAIHVSLHHRTFYRYDRPVTLGPQTIRLRPAPHCRTRILSYSLKVAPEPHFLNWQQDPHGNHQARLVFPKLTTEFEVVTDLVAEMAVFNPFDFFLEPTATHFPWIYDDSLNTELIPYLHQEPLTPKLEAFLKTIDRKPAPTIDFLVSLNQRVKAAVLYELRMEPGVQTPEETLTRASGSCRDSAWLLVQILRHLGIAARFVSGYLIQLAPDIESLDGPSGPAKDFTDLHAWAEAYLPGAGWVGFDPTSGLAAGEGHLPLACTPKPSRAAPISGAVDSCEVTFGFEMTITRVSESPRVTKPYSEERWAEIDALGERIDAELLKRDVRLTMGGEPTFVSTQDMEGAEWNSAALGPNKRKLAEVLARRLWERYGTGGLLHFGQGKWYPGESLPRWALSCLWRKDGEPIWSDPTLIADLAKPGGRGVRDAHRFGLALAGRLGLDPKWLMPGYEDSFYYLWRERRLPMNVEASDSRLRDREERERLARVFEGGLGALTGYALPLERGQAAGRLAWISGPWHLRTAELLLTPGDHPMGYRLPLESQPWVSPSDARFTGEPDPMLDLPPLAPSGELSRQLRKEIAGEPPGKGRVADHLRPRPQMLPPPDKVPGPNESAGWIVRTALCVQPREGHLFVFMPPTQAAEHYLDLLAAVEATAAELRCPVILEGYLPPYDPRLDTIKVTPDPGVIEVNIHPSSTWRGLSERTEYLYAVARVARLGADKFMLDGRHTGTGGGNHIVIGGEKPSDSPILRRPSLLKSLVAYWHQHPSLSYVFSGLFIGPTSQAPRVDEARNDSLYELEIAFRELERREEKGDTPPWLVDRIFRNLLTDVTGNTHRAEFCIDKLYSPESASGRLGLLEMRAFEMPPHARMSLAQQLLLRGLVCRFWDQPFEPGRLVRWGTDLHDRFMLPHYCRQDFADVIADLRGSGFAFEESWFAPHFEFRFPLYGRVQSRGVELELRQALEPWHVLGEEPGAGGTVRFVDSSVERLQVKAEGLTPERYYVACNGIRVPLQPTGVNGEYVAGVRFRAWQPPLCLHPTIGVDTPLVFDLVDSWNRKAVGGCTYHVAHPGGRNYSTFPVNAYEAESRRLARFQPHGHTPGELMAEPPKRIAPELPHTLDLRDPLTVERR